MPLANAGLDRGANNFFLYRSTWVAFRAENFSSMLNFYAVMSLVPKE